jgi:hypothetical protein
LNLKKSEEKHFKCEKSSTPRRPKFCSLRKMGESAVANELTGRVFESYGLNVLRIWFLHGRWRGHAVAQLVEALRYKPAGRRFDS